MLRLFENRDCMEGMAEYPDKFFDLAIVDPPYNVGASDGKFGRGGKGGNGYSPSYYKDLKHYANKDQCPDMNYFSEIFRISKNQIIWGSNYYPRYLYHSGAIIWNKKEVGPLSDAEIAFQSFNKLVKVFNFKWFGFVKDKGSLLNNEDEIIHPNQKPIALYRWLLENYAKPGDKILDTHVGSASSLIACEALGFEYVGFEIDEDYYEAAKKRLETWRSLPLFDEKKSEEINQLDLAI